MFKEDSYLLWRHIQAAARSIPTAVIHTKSIVMKCNVCGDSKTNSRKKRGNIVWDRKRDMVYYKCFNEGDCPVAGDGNAMSGTKWLKTYFPHVYQQYMKELMANNSSQRSSLKPIAKQPIEPMAKINNPDEVEEERKAAKYFVSIKSNNKLSQIAKNYCEKRQIPEEFWSKFYVSIGGKYKNRMIIPFYNRDGSIYYYQARDLVGLTPKYLNRKTNRDSAIYGIDFVNKNEPVIVTEGPIDSMFIENGIATLGLSITDEVREQLDSLKCHYLFDNDEPGKQASLKYIDMGHKVFNWSKYLKDHKIRNQNIKDINDLFIETNRVDKFSYNDFSSYFTSSYFDRVYFRGA